MHSLHIPHPKKLLFIPVVFYSFAFHFHLSTDIIQISLCATTTSLSLTGIGIWFVCKLDDQSFALSWHQLSSVTQSCLTLWDSMDWSMPGLSVHHQFPEVTQTHVHQVSDAIQPSQPLLSSFPPAFNLFQHWVFCFCFSNASILHIK